MKLVSILGSVTPPGRMRAALRCTVEVDGVDGELIDLADHRVAFADGRPPEALGDDTAKIVAAVRAADAVILASPVYRGSFTGSLKNLLDHLPVESLAGKPVGIVAMGATQHHHLGVDWHLRDVLAWFGALVAPTSVYLASADFENGVPVESAQRDLASLTHALVALAKVAPPAGTFLGPRPLAAKRS